MSILVALLMVATASTADVVHLKDGTSVEGIVRHTDEGWSVKTGAKVVRVSADQVESIELTPTTSPSPAVAAVRLESLRRSVDALADLNDIIARFQRFIDQDTDPATANEAKKDLALWQDRQQQKMVKVGSKWVLPSQRQQLIDQAGESAEMARQLMKQGRTKEAEPLLVDCVSVDPQNATALYLIGLLRYDQEQIPAARKAFESTAAIIPNHTPTLNNLAVVLWRQKQFIQAIVNFDAAMLATPVDKTVLDNVAVSFQNLPAELQKSPVSQKALRHFNEQDQKLSERMSREGLHRCGSLWVSDKDLELIRQQEKQIQDRLDQMAGDFDQTKDRVKQLNLNIASNQTQMKRMEDDSYITDPRTGVQTKVPYPSAYYEMASDNDKMTRDRDADLAKLDLLKKQARDLQNSKPSVKNQGVLIMIGPEGTPIRINGAMPIQSSQAAASTQPATR